MRLFYVEKIRFVMFTKFSQKKLETVSVFYLVNNAHALQTRY